MTFGLIIDLSKQTEVVEAYNVDVIEEQTEPQGVRIEVVYSKEGIEKLIRETFPEAPNTAVAIAKCESSLEPTAHNTSNRDGTSDGGIFQLNSVHDTALEARGLNKWNTEDNIKFARMLYESSGFIPWVCYNKGLYRKYL